MYAQCKRGLLILLQNLTLLSNRCEFVCIYVCSLKRCAKRKNFASNVNNALSWFSVSIFWIYCFFAALQSFRFDILCFPHRFDALLLPLIYSLLIRCLFSQTLCLYSNFEVLEFRWFCPKRICFVGIAFPSHSSHLNKYIYIFYSDRVKKKKTNRIEK